MGLGLSFFDKGHQKGCRVEGRGLSEGPRVERSARDQDLSTPDSSPRKHHSTPRQVAAVAKPTVVNRVHQCFILHRHTPWLSTCFSNASKMAPHPTRDLSTACDAILAIPSFTIWCLPRSGWPQAEKVHPISKQPIFKRNPHHCCPIISVQSLLYKSSQIVILHWAAERSMTCRP